MKSRLHVEQRRKKRINIWSGIPAFEQLNNPRMKKVLVGMKVAKQLPLENYPFGFLFSCETLCVNNARSNSRILDLLLISHALARFIHFRRSKRKLVSTQRARLYHLTFQRKKESQTTRDRKFRLSSCFSSTFQCTLKFAAIMNLGRQSIKLNNL